MCSILNRNAILTGDLDAICLVCEAHLRGEEDAVLHIAKPIHKKNLDATSFLEKYKDDHVRKVKKGYYCEFCNIFMKTAAKVGPHVAEPKHCERKTLQPFKREGNGVLAFNKVHIPENAWHGLTEDTCALCDAEFDNALIHKTEVGHILNLVLTEIGVDDKQNVYRKVDESTFQCLTCNVVWAQIDMTEHFNSPEHKKRYQKCCNSAKILINEPQKETPEPAKEDNQNKMLEKEKPKEEVKDETPKEEKPKATPKKQISKEDKSKNTPEVKDVEPEKKPEAKKDKDATATKTVKMGKTDQEICKTLGAVDYVAKDVSGKQWCILCDWAMDQQAVQTHIESRHHQNILKMHQERAAKKDRENDKQPDSDGDDTKTNKKTDENTNDDDQKEEGKSKIKDAAEEFQKNDIQLDIAGSSAQCRVCSKTVEFDYNAIKKHIDEHKKKPAKANRFAQLKSFVNSSDKRSTALVSSPVRMTGKIDKPKQEKVKESKVKESAASTREIEAVTETYAKEHNLVYNKEKNSAFCRVCITKIPPSLKNMKEHINGVSHKNKVALADIKPVLNALTKSPSHEFIDALLTVENIFQKDIVINGKYCLNIYSFFMMTRNGSNLRCQGCEMNLTSPQVDAHNRTSRHERVINEVPVVSSERSEFIREVRPDVFHCGFCNQLGSPWSTMDAHLKSTAHREAKTAANWRLQAYAPDIAKHGAQQTMELMLFHRMLLGQMFGDD